MRTTLDIDGDLLRVAKKHAAERGTTLTKVIEDSLRLVFRRRTEKRAAFRLRLLTRKGRPVPGVDLSDRDALYERMEGRG